MSDSIDEARVRLGAALADVLPDDLAIKWVALVEVMDSEGERCIVNLTSPDLTAWDSIGMLGYALQLEQAGVVVDKIKDD